MKAVTRVIGKQVKINASDMELNEKLLSIDRVTKVVKGGRRLHFRALMIVGDQNGHVGVGLAKASGVPEAIHKASAAGRRELIEITIKQTTIAHEILAKFGASKVLLRPAAPGKGMIASNTVRAVLEMAGIKDIVSKSLGSSNKVNVARATILGLANLKKEVKTAIEDLEEGEEE